MLQIVAARFQVVLEAVSGNPMMPPNFELILCVKKMMGWGLRKSFRARY